MDNNSQNDLGLQTGKLWCIPKGGPFGGPGQGARNVAASVAWPPTPM